MRRTKRRINRRYHADRTLERGKPSGKKTQQILMSHAIKRAFERYDVRLTLADIEEMGNSIRFNKGVFVEAQSASRTAWVVPLKGVEYPVIYNKSLGCVTTVLPRYVLEKWKPSSQPVPADVLE